MTKKTLLHDRHVELGAKMVDFAGWHMPVQYVPIVEEHKTVREAVGIFDVSHMGEIFVKGKDAQRFLDSLVPQDITKLVDSKAVYCQLTNEKAGLIDDLIIYKLADEYYLIIANASRVDEDINWLAYNKKEFDVEIINESHNYSLLAVQGPKTSDLFKLMGVQELPSFFHIAKGKLLGIDVWFSRTGYTGEDGVEVLLKNEHVLKIWDAILEQGREFGIKPIGLGARDTLRLEAGLHLYGNDLDEETTPIEAGLSWSVSKTKESDYNGKKIIEEQLKNGVSKTLVGLKMLDRAIARHGYEVFFEGSKVGIVTSGGISPTRGDNIALAYLKKLDNLSVGSTIQIMIREKLYNAEVINLPFVKKRNK